MEGFELFEVQSLNRVVDKITITKNFQINFPSAFYKKNNLQNKKAVYLYYNKTTKQVALEFKNDVDDIGFKLCSPNEGKNGGYITAKKFFALNGIDSEDFAHRYDYEVRQDDTAGAVKQFFVLQLEPKF